MFSIIFSQLEFVDELITFRKSFLLDSGSLELKELESLYSRHLSSQNRKVINLCLTQDQVANVVAKELMKYQAVLNLNMNGLCGSDFTIL